MKKSELVFDIVIYKQMKKIKDKSLKKILIKMFNKIELNGKFAGKCLDNKLQLYECKNKSPSIRLYFKLLNNDIEIYLFEYEIKKSKIIQQKTIGRIKSKIQDLFLYIFFFEYFVQIQGVFYII